MWSCLKAGLRRERKQWLALLLHSLGCAKKRQAIFHHAKEAKKPKKRFLIPSAKDASLLF